MNYFKLFNLKTEFSINSHKLKKKFYELQLKYHPDSFNNTIKISENEKKKKSYEINLGFKILKNKIKRSIHLLKIHNYEIKEIKKNNLFIQNFLKKQFNWQEELNIACKKKKINHVEKIFCKIKKKYKKKILEISQQFKKKKFSDALITIYQLIFFDKFIKQIKLKKKLYDDIGNKYVN